MKYISMIEVLDENIITSRFIYLLGVEGVGKTTQAKLLARRLKIEGYRTLIVRIRSHHLIVHILRILLMKLKITEERLWSAASVGSWREVEWPTIVKKLFPFILLCDVISVIFLSLVKVFIPLALGFIVIAENYIIDTYSDLQRELIKAKVPKNCSDRLKWLMNTLLRLMPKSSTIIILDADYDTLISRYKKRASPIEPLDYIEIRRKQLFKLSSLFGHPYVINTSNMSPSKTLATIFRLIARECRHV